MDQERKIVLITGATSGFGEAMATIFAEHNWNIIITGRRKDKLEQLATFLASEFLITALALPFDIRKLEETKNALDSIPFRLQNIDLLVNNAGLASGFSNIQDGDIEDWEKMIDTNIKGLLYVSKMIIP